MPRLEERTDLLKVASFAAKTLAEELKCRRELTPFERRCKLDDLDKEQNLAEERIIEETSEIIALALKRLSNDIKRALDGGDLTATRPR